MEQRKHNKIKKDVAFQSLDKGGLGMLNPKKNYWSSKNNLIIMDKK